MALRRFPTSQGRLKLSTSEPKKRLSSRVAMLLEPGQNHRTGLIRRVGFRENSREWTHFDQRVEAARFFFDY
jgi:D-alanyl-D-alanine dipeptidase